MATITLEYNARSRTAKKILSLIIAMDDLFRVIPPKEKDDSLMTKEEHFAMLDSRIASSERGHYKSFADSSQLINHLSSL
ncbi:MAG: hypothetical protein LBR67_00130 [Dysgonamonadaceae bacterium]|jgi:hypothetical protein|nr:hypothetical protein [Dysgonamonadaceae bacterium]